MKMLKSVVILLCMSFSSTLACAGELPSVVVAKRSIPDGAIHQGEKIFRKQPPGSQFDYAVFWYQIASLSQDKAKNTKNSGIILKSCQVVGKDSSGKVVFSQNFDGNTTLSPAYGGLYSRNPTWFDPSNKDYHTPIVQQMVTNDGLVINASSTPDMIAHWWTDRFPYNSSLKYQLEMKVRIMGDVGLQIGGDYWKGQSSPHNGWHKECAGKNNCEAFVSQWYGDTGAEYITIKRDI